MPSSRKERAPIFFASRMHDQRGPFGSIVSVSCEGPACPYCIVEQKQRDEKPEKDKSDD